MMFVNNYVKSCKIIKRYVILKFLEMRLMDCKH